MKKLVLILVCLVAPILGSQAGNAPNDAVWITIGSDAMSAVRAEFEDRKWTVYMKPHRTNPDVTLMRATEKQLITISRLMHKSFGRCGGFLAHDNFEQAIAFGHRGLLDITPKRALSYTLDRATEVNTVVGDLAEQNILNTITSLVNFGTRYYTSQGSVNAANWLKGQWETMATGRSDVSVDLVSHSFLMPSVVATITGAHQPQDIIVMGGHLDSINQSGSSAPGADDDASGIATLTEIFRAAMANGYVPARTIKFIGYAAEEVGLRGSSDIAAAAQAAGDNVIGVMQLDMTLYKGSSDDIWLMQDYTNAAQNSFIVNLISTYTTHSSNSTSSCGYGCSDHASWHNRGFAASMPFESHMSSYNSNIHTANDTIANAGGNASHAIKFARMGAAYLVELGKGGLEGDPGPDPGPVGGGSSSTELTNGQTLNGLSASTGNEATYFISVPAGATNLVISTTGSNGDIDLYVKHGVPPTTSSYDYSSTSPDSNESSSIPSPSTGDYHILVHAYSGYSNATLTASFNAPGGNVPPVASFDHSTTGLTADFTDTSTDSDGFVTSWSWDFGDTNTSTSQNPSHTYATDGSYSVNLTVTDDNAAADNTSDTVTVSQGGCSPVNWTESSLSGGSGSWQHFTLVVPDCNGTLTASMSGGSGDADLYVRYGSQPTTNSYTCRPYLNGNNESCNLVNPSAGTWYISVRGYSSYSGVSLTADFQ